ncbi:MAG: acyl CoA:acetate/3-ketoacid CoA transferase [Alphaproteobacteria bacterium]|nr:acyl CoA:acetate/3-ketoacid CoA transferase [Alphaproteobacteria bacterium]MBO6862669.1 acyl CoA:acetate/3-ketoacid CoA transferase [Alphaproteobacteria bacterium]
MGEQIAMKNKIVSADEAVAIIRSGDTIANSGFVGAGTPDALLEALARRFDQTGAPSDLTLIFAAGQGDGKERGLNRLAAPGLVRRAIGGHWGLIPKLAARAVAGEMEAYNLPQGAISNMYRDIAAGRPGSYSKVGLGTFVDPRQDGGKINAATSEDIVTVETRGDEEFLFYRTHPIQIALIRGTTADSAGNITMEREALTLDNLAMAMAAKNSGGFVLAQVERIAEQGSLPPRQVRIPGNLVDCVVVAEGDLHRQTYATAYSPAFAQEIRAPMTGLAGMPLDERKIIARRCAFELPMNGIVNLGIGMPEGVARVAAEEKILRYVTLTAESGAIGGIPASGLDFGATVNADTILDQNQQFDFYDGGGLDLACLGLAQADRAGNVNVSRFGPRLAGAGGFINISQNAKKVVFAGSFTAGGLAIRIADGGLRVDTEGKARKFLPDVEQITFSGSRAHASGRQILYVTERCVFRLGEDGLVLTEIAPGADLERDVLAQMNFTPQIDGPIQMDSRIFDDAPMGLIDDLTRIPLEDRLTYRADAGALFLNFEGLSVRTTKDVDAIRDAVARVCDPLGRKVRAVVNYDSFTLDETVADAYATMVSEVVDTYYTDVSRYTTSAFLRLKLGEMLSRRGLAPHIYESEAEARRGLGC